MESELGHGVLGWMRTSPDSTAVSDRGLSVCKTSFIENMEISQNRVQLGMAGTGVGLCLPGNLLSPVCPSWVPLKELASSVFL